jgi:uncharacterized membrane protein
MKKFFLLATILACVSAFAQFTYTSLDDPAGNLTTARGISNRGDIVGAYRVTPPRHALLISNGQFLPLAPMSLLAADYSEAFKINNRGDVVGSYIGDDGFFHGFLLRKGVLTTLDFPGASQTELYGINDSGVVVGEWDILDPEGNLLAYHGFLWRNGDFSEVNFPGSGDTALVGIWDSGITDPTAHGFAFSKGSFSSFDVPGGAFTQADDISDNGQIVGVYLDAVGVEHGFLKFNDVYTTLDFPGAATTTAWGVNNWGMVVGTYRDTSGATHGFIAQSAK